MAKNTTLRDRIVNSPNNQDLGLVYNTFGITDQQSTGLSNNVLADVGSDTISVPAGTYRIEMGWRPQVDASATPSYALSTLYLTETDDTIIYNSGRTGIPFGRADEMNNYNVNTREHTFASDVVLKLRGLVEVTGGTVTNLSISQAYVLLTKVS